MREVDLSIVAYRPDLALLGRLYPGDHPVGRLGVATDATIATLTAGDLAGPLFVVDNGGLLHWRIIGHRPVLSTRWRTAD